MDNKRISYTAANSLPLKICKNQDLLREINFGRIIPWHAQIIPTNKCNLNCTFCSCKKRNSRQELSLIDIIGLAEGLRKLNCQAVTITGGGEPLMHPGLAQILKIFFHRNIHVGLVTNGLLLGQLNEYDLNCITWCRISCCDERKLNSNAEKIIIEAVQRGSAIDWAFSYVISKDFDPGNLRKYVNLANKLNFTHVRVVSDLIDLKQCVDMETVKKALGSIDDSRVIYQGRKEFTPGQKECYISLLKPVIGADGFIYPCCGSQYSLKEDNLDMPESMRMAHIDNIIDLYREQRHFDGSVCYKCYYKNYNDLLSILLNPINHQRFV